MSSGTNGALISWQGTGHVKMTNLILKVEIRSATVAQLTAAHDAPAQAAGFINLVQQCLVALREVPYPTQRRLIAPACLDQVRERSDKIHL